jgi:8-oxo-dGTP diphosphatase
LHLGIFFHGIFFAGIFFLKMLLIDRRSRPFVAEPENPCARRKGFALPPFTLECVDNPQEKAAGHNVGPALRFVAAALIVRDGEVLIGQRRADQPMASLWEFPGGKIEPGESPQQALARELTEELGIRAEVGPAVTRIRHHYRRGGAVDLQFFAVREFAGEIDNQIYQQVRWVKLAELTDYEFLAADRGLIRDLAAGKLL